MNGKLALRRETAGSAAAARAPSPAIGNLGLAEPQVGQDEGPRLAEPVAAAALVEGLFRSQAPQLLRFLGRRTARPDDAADLLQEAFLRFTRLLVVGPPPARPEAYLQRIVSNLLRDSARRGAARSEALHGPLEAQPIVDLAPGPADHVEALEMLRAYEACLLRMSPRTREVFLLHRRDELTYAQIAAVTGLSVSGVEKRMMKAIAHIDRELGRSG